MFELSKHHISVNLRFLREVSTIDRASVRGLDTKGCADKRAGQNSDIGWSGEAFVKQTTKEGTWH